MTNEEKVLIVLGMKRRTGGWLRARLSHLTMEEFYDMIVSMIEAGQIATDSTGDFFRA